MWEASKDRGDGDMIKFGVCADLHIDIVPDSEKRLQAFLEECERQKTDFIIHLGDFCYPPGKKRCDCRIENMPVNSGISDFFRGELSCYRKSRSGFFL